MTEQLVFVLSAEKADMSMLWVELRSLAGECLEQLKKLVREKLRLCHHEYHDKNRNAELGDKLLAEHHKIDMQILNDFSSYGRKIIIDLYDLHKNLVELSVEYDSEERSRCLKKSIDDSLRITQSLFSNYLEAQREEIEVIGDAFIALSK